MAKAAGRLLISPSAEGAAFPAGKIGNGTR